MNDFGMFLLMLSNQDWPARFGSTAYKLIASIGGPGLLLLAMADSSFLSVPEGNDLLIVVLSIGRPWSTMAYYVTITIIGSVIGCLLLYSVGRKGGSLILRRKFSQQSVERAERLYKRYGILAVVVPSILPPPTPFKIFVLSAGVFRLKPLKFLAAVVVGRTIRYSMWGILAVLYGNSVKSYMRENLNLVGTILFGCLALAITVIVAFCVRRVRRKPAGKEIQG
jgi:membrane protein YqaA with SNARE-associated domain